MTAQVRAENRRTLTQEEAKEMTAQATVDQASREQAMGKVALADEILDEIEEVLEENAEGFISSYVQRGGQ